MDLTISSNLEADYLLIKVSGSVTSIKDMKLFTKRIYDEFMKYNTKKVVIDETEYQPPDSLFRQAELVNFYSEELPMEIRHLKVAIVTDSKYKRIADFWETYAHNRGYYFKLFYSMEEARTYMSR